MSFHWCNLCNQLFILSLYLIVGGRFTPRDYCVGGILPSIYWTRLEFAHQVIINIQIGEFGNFIKWLRLSVRSSVRLYAELLLNRWTDFGETLPGHRSVTFIWSNNGNPTHAWRQSCIFKFIAKIPTAQPVNYIINLFEQEMNFT